MSRTTAQEVLELAPRCFVSEPLRVAECSSAHLSDSFQTERRSFEIEAEADVVVSVTDDGVARIRLGSGRAAPDRSGIGALPLPRRDPLDDPAKGLREFVYRMWSRF